MNTSVSDLGERYLLFIICAMRRVHVYISFIIHHMCHAPYIYIYHFYHACHASGIMYMYVSSITCAMYHTNRYIYHSPYVSCIMHLCLCHLSYVPRVMHTYIYVSYIKYATCHIHTCIVISSISVPCIIFLVYEYCVCM